MEQLPYLTILEKNARSAEGWLELGYCYYRQGLFDLAGSTLRLSLGALTDHDADLKGIALVRLATVERHAGRLHDALGLLKDAGCLIDSLAFMDQGTISS